MSSEDAHTPDTHISGGFEVVEAPVMDSDSPPQASPAVETPAVSTLVPELSEAADFAAADAVEVDAEGVDAVPTSTAPTEVQPIAQEPEPRTRGLYFVRIPRPTVDDTEVKELQAEFQAQVARLRVVNEKLQIKRGERNELRKQVSLAKSLRDGSQPEYEDKLVRLTGLRNLRRSGTDEMKGIRTSLKGLEARTEAELDDRISELESRIQYGQVELREEKQIVQQISKLQAQRERVRVYESQNSSRLGELEGETSKVKAVIAELESEFNILKGERDQAIKIMQELRGKLDTVDAAYKALEEEQGEATAEKNRTLEALNKARVDMDAAMKDYRENRKFSLLIRDMVAAHQMEQAKAMCGQQVETLMATLNSDSSYRKEYFKLWSEQRKYVVSDLLPDSAPADVRKPEPRLPGAAGRGGGGAHVRAPPPRPPQGKLKAEGIIAAALEQATRELAVSAATKTPDTASEEDDESDPEPIVVPVVARKAANDSVFKHKVELPAAVLAPAEEFVVPEVAKSQPRASVEDQKATVRADNQRKAAEAEARKKRRLEATERKRLRAAEGAKRRAEELKARAALGASSMLSSAAEDSEAPVTDFSAAEATAEDTDTGAEASAPAPLPTPALRKAVAKRAVAAERPIARLPRAGRKDKGAKAKLWFGVHPNVVALVVALLFVLLMIGLWAFK